MCLRRFLIILRSNYPFRLYAVYKGQTYHNKPYACSLHCSNYIPVCTPLYSHTKSRPEPSCLMHTWNWINFSFGLMCLQTPRAGIVVSEEQHLFYMVFAPRTQSRRSIWSLTRKSWICAENKNRPCWWVHLFSVCLWNWQTNRGEVLVKLMFQDTIWVL